MLSRRDRVTDALGGEDTTFFDAVSRPYCVADPLGRETYFQYDAAGQLVATVSPLGSSAYYDYDGAGRLSAITNSLGETVSYDYDAVGRQTVMLDPLDNPTYYDYDAVGRQTAEIDAIGEEQAVAYDAAGRIVRLDKASGVGAYYEYDAVGRVLSELRYPSGEVIAYDYDARGAVTGVQKTGVDDQSWEYDAAGRVLHFAQGGNHLYYQYDAAGRRTAMAQVVGEDLLTTYYTYRACGNLNSITDPWGQTVSYDYDDLGREIAKALPNGVTTYHNYDAASQVTQVAHLGPNGVLLSFDYTYDTDGRRTKIVREDGTSIYYGYDTVGRLTSEEWLSDSDIGIYSFAYEFDAAGNRSLLTKDGVTTYYCYNTLNQLSLTESTEGALAYYTYQADGALATKHDADGWAYYEWDVDEALLRVTRDGTVTGQATELYDAQMKRVARDLDGVATYYVFDGEKIARVEQPEAGTRDFYVQEGQSIYSPLVSVHDESADAQYWYLFDALGSTMGLADANGNLSGKLQYDAFGDVLSEVNVPRSAFFKYVGAYQYMPEAFEDMMLLWHRWYDPTAGRFVGRDHLGATPAHYDYALGDPAAAVDANGLDPRSARMALRVQGGPRSFRRRKALARLWAMRELLGSGAGARGIAPGLDLSGQVGVGVGVKAGCQALFLCADGSIRVYCYWCVGQYALIGASLGVGGGAAWGVTGPDAYAGSFHEVGGGLGEGLVGNVAGSISPDGTVGSVFAGPGIGAGWPPVNIWNMACQYYRLH